MGATMDKNQLHSHSSTKRTFCTFYLNNHLFGIDILDIKEINSEKQFTAIDHSPKEIKGYVNIRGQIYLIAKMNTLIGYDDREEDQLSSKKLILFKTHIAESLGIEVDKIGDVVDASEEDIVDRRKSMADQSVEPDERRKDRSGIGSGVCKLSNQIMVIVNAKKIAETLIKEM